MIVLKFIETVLPRTKKLTSGRRAQSAVAGTLCPGCGRVSQRKSDVVIGKA